MLYMDLKNIYNTATYDAIQLLMDSLSMLDRNHTSKLFFFFFFFYIQRLGPHTKPLVLL